MTLELEFSNAWKREFKNAFKDPYKLISYLELTDKISPQRIAQDYSFPMLVTQHFVDLMEKGNPQDPLLLQVLPWQEEELEVAGFVAQPLAEEGNFIPVRNIVHKYSNRLLFLPKASCAINCRYCFRRNFPYQELGSSKEDWQQALDYAYQQNIEELILSGGDPLMMDDKEFYWLAQQLLERNQTLIKGKVTRLRIHSRLPVVLPNRITPSLLEIFAWLKQNGIQPIIVWHINHAQEVSEQLAAKCRQLQQAGVVLLNQSVLLKGVNDKAITLKELSEALFTVGVMPYYLHLLDKVTGASHYYVSDEQASEIYRELQAITSGYLVPKLAREEVGKPNKTLYN